MTFQSNLATTQQGAQPADAPTGVVTPLRAAMNQRRTMPTNQVDDLVNEARGRIERSRRERDGIEALRDMKIETAQGSYEQREAERQTALKALQAQITELLDQGKVDLAGTTRFVADLGDEAQRQTDAIRKMIRAQESLIEELTSEPMSGIPF